MSPAPTYCEPVEELNKISSEAPAILNTLFTLVKLTVHVARRQVPPSITSNCASVSSSKVPVELKKIFNLEDTLAVETTIVPEFIKGQLEADSIVALVMYHVPTFSITFSELVLSIATNAYSPIFTVP